MEDPACPIIIAGSADWHKGLVGLAASRLTDRFQRPSLIFSHDEATGDATGSARSIAGVDIGAAVRAAVDAGFAKKGGGHTMAAGVTVTQTGMREFSAYMRDALKNSYRAAAGSATLAVDGALTPRSATPNSRSSLSMPGPSARATPRRVFACPRYASPCSRSLRAAIFAARYNPPMAPKSAP